MVHQLLLLVSAQAQASMVVVGLLGHRIAVWSSSTMCGCIAEGATLALATAEGLALAVCMVVGCSCRLGMILANLALGSTWLSAWKIVVVTTRCS